jgi:hypothetical protein
MDSEFVARLKGESDEALGANVGSRIDLVCRNPSTVTMRFRAVLAGSKPTLLSCSGTTGWTSDSEYLFWGEFCFHAEAQYPKPMPGVGTLAHTEVYDNDPRQRLGFSRRRRLSPGSSSKFKTS